MPTKQMTAVGVWGIGAIIAMGITGQIPGFPIDWSQPFIETPLSTWVVALAVGVGGYWKGSDQ